MSRRWTWVSLCRRVGSVSSLSADGAADIAQILDLLPAHLRDAELLARADVHLPRLHGLFHQLYGDHPDGFDRLLDVVTLAATSWATRPLELKALDRHREAN